MGTVGPGGPDGQAMHRSRSVTAAVVQAVEPRIPACNHTAVDVYDGTGTAGIGSVGYARKPRRRLQVTLSQYVEA